MNYYMVQGILIITDPNELDPTIMDTHIAYSQKAMDAGKILLSGLKSDMSGGFFLMKCESRQELDDYLFNEPLHLANAQDYEVTEIQPHFFNPSLSEWIAN